MADGAWKKDISKYNIKANWSEKFDTTDYKKLSKAGYNDKQIGAYVQGLQTNQVDGRDQRAIIKKLPASMPLPT